jgi:hypothetical protein
MKLDIKQFHPCGEGLEYYETNSSFEEAWNDCERGDWMLWIAKKLEVDDRLLTKAKALCANTVRHLMKDIRSTAAIDAALRYANGEISRKELDEYSAYAAYDAAYDAAYAAYAAADAAYAAADADTLKSNLHQTAGICREVLTEAVFGKVKEMTTN